MQAPTYPVTALRQINRLVLLAPDIVEAILAGRQSAHVTLKDLMDPFPVEWEKQRVWFCQGQALCNRNRGRKHCTEGRNCKPTPQWCLATTCGRHRGRASRSLGVQINLLPN